MRYFDSVCAGAISTFDMNWYVDLQTSHRVITCTVFVWVISTFDMN